MKCLGRRAATVADIEIKSGYLISIDSWVIQATIPVSEIDFRRQTEIIKGIVCDLQERLNACRTPGLKLVDTDDRA